MTKFLIAMFPRTEAVKRFVPRESKIPVLDDDERVSLDYGMTWIRVNEEIDAVVQFHPSSSIPALKAILWKGQARRFVGIPRVRRDLEGLSYDIRDPSARYAIRFDRQTQQWTLEGLDDFWILAPHDPLRPRSFLPP